MKESAGEANMTVVTIVIISVVVAIATPIIRNMASSTERRSCCVNDGGEWTDGNCSNGIQYARGCSEQD